MDTPIVGQPMRLGAVQLLVAFTCLCKDTNAPMLIQGVGHIARCTECKGQYAIMKSAFDRSNNGPMSVQVAKVVVN